MGGRLQLADPQITNLGVIDMGAHKHRQILTWRQSVPHQAQGLTLRQSGQLTPLGRHFKFGQPRRRMSRRSRRSLPMANILRSKIVQVVNTCLHWVTHRLNYFRIQICSNNSVLVFACLFGFSLVSCHCSQLEFRIFS